MWKLYECKTKTRNTVSWIIQIMRKFFENLGKANLTVHLAKSNFWYATVEYLGHKVGQGYVTPIIAKVDTIVKFPIPRTRKT
jgi:hypothetical protein